MPLPRIPAMKQIQVDASVNVIPAGRCYVYAPCSGSQAHVLFCLVIVLDLSGEVQPHFQNSTRSRKRGHRIHADIHSLYLRISSSKITRAKMGSGAENQFQPAGKLDDTASELPERKTAESTESSSKGNVQETSIDPENEIAGTRFLLLHIGLCLTTFITGLVSLNSIARAGV